MKLTRRVLAVIVAVAMLAGVMATGAFAAVGDYDATSNPYTAKIGLKAYRLDESGEYTEITDGKVLDGEVIRVEVWGQTNYYVSMATFIAAYSNSIFVPTKLDGSTYDYNATTPLGKDVIEQIAYDEEAAALADEAVGNNGYAGFDTPYEFNAAVELIAAFAGANNASKIADMYPAAWKNGSAINATGAAYNVLSAGFGPDIAMDRPATAVSGYNMAVVLTEYQPIFTFNLTVDAAANKKGVVTLPEAAVRSSSNTSGRMYVSVGTPNADFDLFGYPLYEAQAIPAGAFSFSQYKDTYEDGTEKDRVVDLSEGTINFTVVNSLDGGDEPEEPVVDKTALDAAIKTLPAFTEDEAEATSWAAYAEALADAKAVYADPNATQDEVDTVEATLLAAIEAVVAKPAVAPELVALGDTIIDEERGFIYGLPFDGSLSEDLVGDGYVEVIGDGELNVEWADGAEGFGTGAKVELVDTEGEVVATYYIVIFGDNDGNGYIDDIDMNDLTDALMFNDCRYDYSDMTIPNVFAMDINADEMVDDADIAYIEDLCMFNIDSISQNYQS